MKLDHIPYQEKVEIVGQAEQNKQQVNWTIERMHKGHTLFEINLETGIVQPAKYDDGTDVVFQSLVGKSSNLATIRKKVKQNKDCVYIPALKKTGAINKWYNQAKKLL